MECLGRYTIGLVIGIPKMLDTAYIINIRSINICMNLWESLGCGNVTKILSHGIWTSSESTEALAWGIQCFSMAFKTLCLYMSSNHPQQSWKIKFHQNFYKTSWRYLLFGSWKSHTCIAQRFVALSHRLDGFFLIGFEWAGSFVILLLYNHYSNDYCAWDWFEMYWNSVFLHHVLDFYLVTLNWMPSSFMPGSASLQNRSLL